MLVNANERPERPEVSGRSRIGVTIGDPAGIGPEVVIKALADRELRHALRPIIIGDLNFLEQFLIRLNSGLSLILFEPGAEAGEDVIEVVDLSNVPDDVVAGIETAETGRASAEYIEAAVQMWEKGEIDAIATAPISKRALKLGGYDYPGHTEFLAELTGTREFAMSFFAEELRVVLLSTHVSLQRAIDLVKKEGLEQLIAFADRTLSSLLARKIRLAVAGLNPHASEGGMFGTEEADEILPAIESCRGRGIDVFGPFSPDTIFLRGYNGEFDAVIACYHDQATIAVKSLSFGSSVNVTLGLPLVRTSVDHGTAFDIAGKNLADASSMNAAIRLASELVSPRTTNEGRRSSVVQ